MANPKHFETIRSIKEGQIKKKALNGLKAIISKPFYPTDFEPTQPIQPS